MQDLTKPVPAADFHCHERKETEILKTHKFSQLKAMTLASAWNRRLCLQLALKEQQNSWFLFSHLLLCLTEMINKYSMDSNFFAGLYNLNFNLDV